MKKKLIIANWKMNKTYQEAQDFIIELKSFINKNPINCKIIIAPPFVYISKAINILNNTNIKIAAQNVSEYLEGPYTGEISIKMLHSLKVNYVILGHSERRSLFQETDTIIEKKIKIALKYGITPIYCCGESLIERNNKQKFEINKKQIETALFKLNEKEIHNIIIAYEPIWAIGTGVNANPIEIQEMHSFIRTLIKKKYSNSISESIQILYGGSINLENIKNIFLQQDVNGGLIGQCSLNPSKFLKIIKSI